MPYLHGCLKLFCARKFISGKRWRFAPNYQLVIMDVKLPKLGEGADSGVVVNVFVKEGDPVAKDQAILELENEKAVASIPSTGAGVVAKIYVKAGDRISIGQRLIAITESGQPAAAAKRAVAKPVQVEDEDEPADESAGEVEAETSDAAVATSPSIRKMARE